MNDETDLNKIRELIFSGVNHNIELGIIMAHGLNISLESTLRELLASLNFFDRKGLDIFDMVITTNIRRIYKKKPRRSTIHSIMNIIEVKDLIDPTKSFNDTITKAIEKLLIIFKNKINGLEK
tara:strand:- start:974 stop:1342 length:369 start_codon:yes stop_codon:yes gene_type:complete